jgi:myo-inositol-1(or 4)-monophosphatase
MYKKELELAKRAAMEAGTLLTKKEGIYVDFSGGKDIKLSSDKASETIIIDILKESNIPILSEECGYISKQGNEYLWIIDPLDGTANYWKGLDELSCVSVALWKNDEPILGVVYRFATDELYYGVIGEGAFKNEKPITTSVVEDASKAVVSTGFPVYRDYSDDGLIRFVKQVQCFKKVRMLGTAAIMGAFVAEGKFDAYMEESIMLWDIAGSAAIVKAAGGALQIQRLDDYKCVCRLFANNKLMEDYNAKSI